MSGGPSVRLALLWSFSERYAGLVLSLGSSMLLARLLTPAQVGVFSLCAAVLAVAGILRDFGVSEYLIQEKELDREKVRAALGVALLIAWSIGLLVLLLRPLMAAFYQEPGVADVLLVLSINFLLLPLTSPAFALLNRDLAFRKIFVIHFVSNLMHYGTSVLLALRGHGYMSLAWGPVAGIATQTLLVAYFRPRDAFLLPSLRGARGVLRYGGLFVSSRLLETFTRNAHELVIARQVGFAGVGLFSRANGLVEMFNTNVAHAVMRVASPAFAIRHRAGESLQPAFARGTAIFTSIAFPFCGFVALMAEDIIHVLFGAQWAVAAPLTRILALGLLPTYLMGLAPNLLLATGNVKRRLQVSFWYCPVHVAGVLAASFVSLQAVATVWAVSGTLTMLLYMHHLRKVLDATLAELFRPSLGSVAVALLVLAAQGAALAGCRLAGWPALLNLAVVGLAGVLAWLAAVRLCRHPVQEEIARLLRRRA